MKIRFQEHTSLLPYLLFRGQLLTLGRCRHLCGRYLVQRPYATDTNDVCCRCATRDPCWVCRPEAL